MPFTPSKKKDIGNINYELEQLRMAVKRAQRQETDPTRAAEKNCRP